MLLSNLIFGQAALPSFYDFQNFTTTANLPVGWTSNITGTFTYATGQAGIAGRLDATGEYVQIYTADPMGAVTYYIKGFLASGSWTGTFTIEESVNGSSWTALNTHTTLNSTTWTLVTVNPNSASRYLRFFFTNKVSGYNVGIDEINIPMGVITAQEINIKQSGNTIFSGGTTALFGSPVGTPYQLNFDVENLGTVGTLNLTSTSITGVAAADYTVTAPSLPGTVSPSSTQTLTVTFNPSVSGSRPAILTLVNDDSNEGNYVINLAGIGGSLATEPTNQPTNLSFNNVKSYRLSSTFVNAAPAPTGYLVIRKNSAAPITDIPVDGVSYMRGDAVGTSKVVYSGSSNVFTLNNITAANTYQIAVFAYNGTGTFTNYNLVNPLIGSVTSAGSMMPPTEYATINTAAPTFIQDLTNLINPHNFVYYSNYDETMINLFETRDTTGGQKVVDCVYSGEKYLYTDPFNWSYMSREHTYCHSWMPTNPADGSGTTPNNVERKEYNDQHHLFPAEFATVNATRSNFPLGIVVTVSGTYLGAKWGQNSLGRFVFEPRDDHKGDAARAIFYMATCYNNTNNAFGVPQNWKFKNPISGTITYGQDQDVLKAWHYQDLPSKWEIARNDFLDSLQGNRNPFIDSVQYACYIDFLNMAKITGPTIPCNTITTGINSTNENISTMSIFPNPSHGDFTLLFTVQQIETYSMLIYDVSGRLVSSQKINTHIGENTKNFNLKLKSGMYFVSLTDGKNQLMRKLVIE